MGYTITRRDTDARCLPLGLGNYSVTAWGSEWDGVISFCFSAKKSHSLVAILQKKHGKRNGLNDNHCKGKEVFIAILEPMDYISTPLGSGGKGGEKSGNLQLGVKETLNKSSAAG